MQDVIRRAHFSFREERGRFAGGHSTYGVEVDARKVSVRPVEATLGAPIVLETIAIGRGSHDFQTPPMAAVDEDGRLVRDGAEVQEVLENRKDGVELSWKFAAPPRGDGDLVVHVAATGMAYAAATAGGLHFRDPDSGLGIRFGRATWVDADGRRTDIQPEWDGRTVRIDVPADVLATAVYPAVLDPLVGPERAIDSPVAGLGSNGHSGASIAYDPGSDEYFVAWTDFRANAFAQVIGTRISAGGAVLDPNGIVLSSLGIASGSPSAVFDGTNFLVAFRGAGVQARRVSPAGSLVDGSPFQVSSSDPVSVAAAANGGTTLVVWEVLGDIEGARVTGSTVLDASPIVLSNAVFRQSVPSVAAGPGAWLVAWQDFRGGLYNDIYGTRVNVSAGAVLDPAGLAISTAPDDQTAPSVASNGTDYLVVFEDQRGSPSLNSLDIYGARVTSAGIVTDPSGFPISDTAPPSGPREFGPSVVFAGGNYQVIWGDDRDGLFGNRVAPGSGALLDGPRGALMSGSPPYSVNGPHICAGGSTYYVAWERISYFDQGDRPHSVLLGSRTSTTPALLDGPGLLLASSGNGEVSPSVATDGSDYFVAWVDNRGGAKAIFGARVDGATGLSLDPSGILLSAEGLGESRPAVAFNGTEYLVVWLESRPGLAIFGARVSTGGTVVDPGGIRLYERLDGQTVGHPAVASNGIDWFVTWATRTFVPSLDIFGGRVSATGAPLDGPDGIALCQRAGAQENPRISYGAGVYLVTWIDSQSDGYRVYGEEVVASTGVPVQPTTVNIPIDTTPSLTAFSASSAYVAPHFVVVDDKGSTIGRVLVEAATGVAGAPASLTGCCGYGPQIAYDGSNFVVVYVVGTPSGYAVKGTRLSMAGVDLDAMDWDVVTAPGLVSGFPSAGVDTYIDYRFPSVGIASPAGATRQSLVTYSRYDATPGVTSDRLRTRLLTPLYADLSITKTDGQAAASVGTPITYAIVVSNAGPGNVTGATVTDVLPAVIVGATWTCAGAGGGTCTASGSGDINDSANLPVGGTVTYTLNGTVSQSAGATLSNTASVAVPAGATDPSPANNSATDTDNVVREADLAITKTDGHAAALAGQPITYTIVASNAGPADVTGAQVADVVPGAILTPTWTCAGAGGGTCGSPSGAGSINEMVNLPVGASVTYTLSGTIDGSATGTLSNTATIAAPAGTTDPSPANNAATDSDPLVTLGPDNDTPAGAKDVQLGSVSSDTLGAAPNDQNWFRYPVRAGRSYCVDVDNGGADTSIRDTVLSAYRADATTVIGSNDDITDEPGGSLLSRVCYIAMADEENYARVTAGANPSASPGGFRVRVVDTTLFCPWFFSGNGFEAFVLIKNTTGSAHDATVRLAVPGGATLSTQSGAVPANGSYNLQVSAAPPTGFGLSAASGGVYIAHDGPPGSLIANVTSLSFGSGVSFDTPASPRQDFR